MKVAIIGGGVMGAGLAWRLARGGADVVVLDDHAHAGSASSAAGGMLAPLAEAEGAGPFLDFGMRSLRRWPTFAAELEAETGMTIGYARAGKLISALTAAEAEALAATYAGRPSGPAGQVEWLDAVQARRLEPAITRDVRAAVLLRDDHRVDNVALLAALRRAAALAGARVIEATATRIVEHGGAVRAVEAGAMSLDADVVIVAAGAWSGQIDGLPRDLPVRPVRGQMLALRPAQLLFERTLASALVYLVPRPDGRVIVGSTMEEAGYDATTTPETLAGLRADAVRLVPGLADAARAGAWAGLRPATSDGLPVLGEDPALPGLWYATGHFRNGILFTPVTVDSIAAAVLGQESPDLAPFSPARFEPLTATNATSGRVGLDRTCDICGAEMYSVHCKVICPACGYKRDCSDLW